VCVRRAGADSGRRTHHRRRHAASRAECSIVNRLVFALSDLQGRCVTLAGFFFCFRPKTNRKKFTLPN
jgi:hypothetical protein